LAVDSKVQERETLPSRQAPILARDYEKRKDQHKLKL
jgi:hypothetical protein